MKRLKRWQLLVGLAVLALLALVTVVVFRAPPAEEGPALPNPNGYDDLIKAAAQSTGLDVPGRAIDDLSVDELRAAVESNQEALRLARVGLGRECRVPVEFSQTYLASHMPEMANGKRLAQAFRIEGRLAEKEERFSDAARSYLDAVRLGQAFAQGGFLIDRLVGVAMEAIGMVPLSRLIDRLEAKDCRELVATLEKVDSTREPWEMVMRRERTFALRTMGWRYRLYAPFFNRMARQSSEGAHRHAQLLDAHVRLLELELALQCHRLEKGGPAQSLGVLVSAYLKTEPLDPFSRKPFIYRLEGNDHKLYSVGPDGKDDGGVSVGKSAGAIPPGDVLLSSPY